jgi:DNA-directed RNA polymerase subunit RPC12/RpoP
MLCRMDHRRELKMQIQLYQRACLDCGKHIGFGSVRCQSCNLKFVVKNRRK